MFKKLILHCLVFLTLGILSAHDTLTPAYNQRYPYHIKFCGTSGYSLKEPIPGSMGRKDGSRFGHSFTYLRGVCLDKNNIDNPQRLVLCDKLTTSYNQGVGISALAPRPRR